MKKSIEEKIVNARQNITSPKQIAERIHSEREKGTELRDALELSSKLLKLAKDQDENYG